MLEITALRALKLPWRGYLILSCWETGVAAFKQTQLLLKSNQPGAIGQRIFPEAASENKCVSLTIFLFFPHLTYPSQISASLYHHHHHLPILCYLHFPFQMPTCMADFFWILASVQLTWLGYFLYDECPPPAFLDVLDIIYDSGLIK